ncbi:MAG: CBS domain-containing protein [Burkholderiaceae bacterium]|uniref:CBS domain-containing protein n=1 Tax=Herminiimonas sp. Marseille-P9896 TaxID=2742211 RepID=UPI00158DAEE9|nr:MULTISPECIES: CBS domain-containing protein [Oxalobacteraceae]MBX9798573.1 CBS domain-containing protein [Burkholderiaceae bacterium]
MRTVSQLLMLKNKSLCSTCSRTPLIDALKIMAVHDVGAMVVIDEGKLVGILSERDYARKVALANKSSMDICVGEIMTSRVTTVSKEHTVEECMTLMSDGNFRHLPVTERGFVIGVISIGDLVKEVISTQEETIQYLKTYIHS